MAALPRIKIDRSSRVPLYAQVADQLEREILEGRLKPGEKLTNEVALAEQLGVSRPTMRQAISLLVDKGMLVRKRGVGTQVVHGQVRRTLGLTSLFDDLASAGHAPRTRVLSLSRIAAEPESARALDVQIGEEIWSVERLRLIEDTPLALLRNVLRADLVDLSAVDLERSGLYPALREAHVSISVARQRISARAATQKEAKLLGDHPGAPLLTMDRTAYDDAGRAVEQGHHVYRPSLYAFETTLVDR
ncbi:MAG: GntR family transcriptional regulator [Nocardioidaceae bacterium]